jgi:cell fate (sporulation/competence/biofilm development) regulator YlbF (YheA/YmcA/DUF963 family)
MEDLLKTAAALGSQIARHDAFRRLRAAEAAVRSGADTRTLLDDFERQRQKIEELESGRRPVEPEDKHEMQRLSDAVHGNAPLQELMRAQADYMDLMNRVNRTIRDQLDADAKTDASK